MFYNQAEIIEKINSTINISTDSEKFNLIKNSILFNDMFVLDLLLEKDCFVYTIDDELSVFEWCVYRQNMKAFEKLNNYKSVKNFKNDSSLNIAVMLNLPFDIIEYVQENCYNIDVLDNEGMTSVNWAIQNKNNKILEFLLKNGADPNLSSSYVLSNVTLAVIGSDLKSLEVLLEYGAKINPVDSLPLSISLSRYNYILADYMISRGADVNLTDKENRTALFYEAVTGEFSKCEYLINKGADINQKDKFGISPKMIFENEKLKEFLYETLYCGFYEEWDENEAGKDFRQKLKEFKCIDEVD